MILRKLFIGTVGLSVLLVGCTSSGGESKLSNGSEGATSSTQRVVPAHASNYYDVKVGYPGGGLCRLEGAEHSVLVTRGEDQRWLDVGDDGQVDSMVKGEDLYVRVTVSGEAKWWKVSLTKDRGVLALLNGIPQGLDARFLQMADPDPMQTARARIDQGLSSPAELFPGESGGGTVAWTTKDGEIDEVSLLQPRPSLGQAAKTTIRLVPESSLRLPSADELSAASLGSAPASAFVAMSYLLDPACSEEAALDWNDIQRCVSDKVGSRSLQEWVDENQGIEALRPSACFPET